MEVSSKWPAMRGLNQLPWWAYALCIPGVYSLAWIMYLVGIIPGR